MDAFIYTKENRISEMVTNVGEFKLFFKTIFNNLFER